MKRLLLVLMCVSFLGCATVNTPPVSPSSHNTEMRVEDPQSEEAKKLGNDIAETGFWVGISLIISHAFGIWPF